MASVKGDIFGAKPRWVRGRIQREYINAIVEILNAITFSFLWSTHNKAIYFTNTVTKLTIITESKMVRVVESSSYNFFISSMSCIL